MSISFCGVGTRDKALLLNVKAAGVQAQLAKQAFPKIVVCELGRVSIIHLHGLQSR